MSSHDSKEPPTKRKTPLAVPLALIALGATAVIVPLVFLRRARPPNHAEAAASGVIRNVGNANPPPIRRVTSLSTNASPTRPIDNFPASRRTVNILSESHSHIPGRSSPDEQTVNVGGNLGGALYALKALGIATCIVGGCATASVMAIQWAMDVRTAEEFAERVRIMIRSMAPELTSRIHRTSPAISPLSKSNTSASEKYLTSFPEAEEAEPWVSADAIERLSRAYEEGGLRRWMEVAEQEAELEANNRGRRKERPDESPAET